MSQFKTISNSPLGITFSLSQARFFIIPKYSPSVTNDATAARTGISEFVELYPFITTRVFSHVSVTLFKSDTGYTTDGIIQANAPFTPFVYV